MTQEEALRRLKRSTWRNFEKLLRRAYQDGVQEGGRRARGSSRRGRTIREDATVDGLIRLIEEHFGLERYGFEVRIVHAGSGRRVPSADLLRKYRRLE